jgi:hypothetical protein
MSDMTREQARALLQSIRHNVRRPGPRKRIDAQEWRTILRELFELVGAIAIAATDGRLTVDEAKAIGVELHEIGQAVHAALQD